MKYKSMLVVLLMAAIVPLWAEVTAGAEIEFSTEAFHIYSTNAADAPSAAAFSTFDFGDTQFFVEANVAGRVGGRITVKPFHESGSSNPIASDRWWYAWIDDTYMWITLLDFERPFPIALMMQAGEFQRRRMNRFDFILDGRHHYGHLWWNNAQANAVPSIAALQTIETDVMEHFVIDLRLGPVSVEYSPIALKALNPNEANASTRGGMMTFLRDNITYGARASKDTNDFVSRVRVATAEPIDIYNWMLDVSSWYALSYHWESGIAELGGTIGGTSGNIPKQNNFLHRYGLVAAVDSPLGFSMAAAYSGSLYDQRREWASGSKSALTDMTHVWELRGSYSGLENIGLLFEARGKFAWGDKLGETAPTDWANDFTVQTYPSFLFARQDIDASWRFHERMEILGGAEVSWARFYGNALARSEIEARFKPLFRWHILDNTWAQTGVEVRWNNSWQDGSEDWRWDVIVPLKVYARF